MERMLTNIILGFILLNLVFLGWMLSGGLMSVDSNGIIRFTGWLLWCISPFLPLFIISYKYNHTIHQLSWLLVGVLALSAPAAYAYIQALYVAPDVGSGFAFTIIPAVQWVGSIVVSALVIVYGGKRVAL